MRALCITLKKKMPENAFTLRSETRRFKGQPLIFKFMLI